ncbi:MAG: GTP-binding protein, partial [Lentisphaerae bacterium]
RELELELKIIADVGLIGYPNAGKSSLLTAVTNARPETAPYPFTTRHPQVGIVEFDDLYRFTMADIPGIIEGAHENRGLGFEFLRHIERTSILVYVLDMAGTDGRTPWDDLDSLHEELREYNPELIERPSIIAANKMDEPNAEENLERLREHTQLPVFPICAILNEGCPELLQALRQLKEEQKYN